MQNVVMVPLFAYFLYVRCHKFGSRGKNLEKHKANSLTIFADVFESRNVNLSKWSASGLTKARQASKKLHLPWDSATHSSPAIQLPGFHMSC